MPFSGGNYSAPSNSWNPAVTGTTINATDWATLLADLSTALSTCVLKDGSQTITGNLPMSGFKLTGLSAGSTSGDSVRYEQVLLLAGGTMSGNIAMGGNKITGLAAATANGDAVRYEQSPAGIVTAKGSLIAGTASHTVAEFAVGGTDGQALTVNSNTATGMQYAYPALRSYLAGCTLSTAGSSGTMSIAAGTAVDSTGVSAMVLSATSKTTSSWAVGSGNGGLDTGSIANNTWYHFFVIQRVDTGVVDVLFSTSVSSPTLPANYTLKRRIGSGRTNGSAQWTSFVQYGDDFWWLAPVADVSATNPGTSAVTRTLTVPTGLTVTAILNASLSAGSSIVQGIISSLAVTDAAPNATGTPGTNLTGVVSSTYSGGQLRIPTNTSAQVRSRLAFSDGLVVLNLITAGWSDRRGRDD